MLIFVLIKQKLSELFKFKRHINQYTHLKMSGGNSLDFEILGGISGQLQNFGGQVLKYGRTT